jgi:ribosomal protein L40E
MMSDILQSLRCARCGASPLTDNNDGTIACPYCGSTFAHPERVCPRCQTVNELDARQCVSCGQTLRHPCARCGTLNWSQATFCRRCGASLDVLEHIAARRAETTADRIVRLQSSMTSVKEEAEGASQARLAEMWARDNARLEATAKSKAKQQQQERLLWAIATIAILAVLIIMAMTLVAPLLRTH